MDDNIQHRSFPVQQTFHPIAEQPSQQQIPAGNGPDEIDLFQILNVIWRGKWFILMTSLLAMVLGGYYAFAVAVPKYTATARLALQVRDQQVVDLESVMSGASGDEQTMNTEIEVIRSRGLIERLVADLDLLNDPEFNETLRPPSPLSIKSLQATIQPYLPFQLPVEPDPTEEEILLDTAEEVRDVISATAQRKTFLFTISVTTENARKSANMANRLGEIYLDDQIHTKFAATEFAVTWLSGRVSELEEELSIKQNAIKDLRSNTNLISVEALEALNVRSKDLRERLSETEVTSALLRGETSRLSELLAAEDFQELVRVTADPALERLLPDVLNGDRNNRRAYLNRVGRLISEAEIKAQRAETQRDALASSLEVIQQQIEEQNEDLATINQLTREADATRVLYQTFLTRLKETSVQIGLQQADSRILSTAIPGEKVAPRKGIILVISIILGALLGIAVMLLRDLRQDGVRTAEDLEALTGQTVLGQIPVIPTRRRAAQMEYVRTKTTSAVVEAIRNLRTSVMMSDVDMPPKIIMSVSSIPGEGKTTNALTLAINFAGLGKKVLLIEGDIRRRTLNEYFESNPRGSLLSVISEDVPLSEAITSDETLGIDVLVGEKSSMNAADLFSSQKFKAFIARVREDYDIVIIDAPPVLVVPDARIMGQLVDAIIYTVKWDSTSQQQVVNGLRQFSSVGLKVTGLVLSQIDPKGMKKYGYGGRNGAYAQYGTGYYDLD